MITKAPILQNELDRLLNLSDYNLDYSNLDDSFKDLTKLAAGVAGTSISLINIIDSFTQWTISSHGIELSQMPREESVCQYTILEEDHFEVSDLTKDDRFKDKAYVTDQPYLKYYYGTLLKSDGYSIGSLCVFDKNVKSLPPEKMEMLQIIGDEIVNRLKLYRTIESLRNQVDDANSVKNKVVHDIRSPLAGIIGLSEIIIEQGKQNKIDEVLELVEMIHHGGNSIIDLADEILASEIKTGAILNDNNCNLINFKERLEKLYLPQAKTKNLNFVIKTSVTTESISFSNNRLLQIAGNLISNAIKFTPAGGTVAVNLDLQIADLHNTLLIRVKDSGIGLEKQKIDDILNGQINSTRGTDGEQGYGFGLPLIKNLVDGLNGTMTIDSTLQTGACFEIMLPQVMR